MIKRIHSVLFLCKDLNKTAQFYKKAGFSIEKANDAVRIKFGDFRFTFMDESKATIKTDSNIGPKGIGIYMYFEVDNVDSFYQMLIKKILKLPAHQKIGHGVSENLRLKTPMVIN